MASCFENNARVGFIGDSITADGLFIAYVLEYYRTHLKAARVKLCGAGVSGGGVWTAEQYFDDFLRFHPTHAVIMLGMNDIYRGHYAKGATPEMIAEREGRFPIYESGMEGLINRLLSLGIKVTLCSPTPYDEGLQTDVVCLHGCARALAICTDICRGLCAKYGLDFIDMNTELCALNEKLHAKDPTLSVEGPDRVHPHERGHAAMARVFLRAQGFDVAPPTVDTMLDGSVALPLSDEGKARLECERKIRPIYLGEAQFLRNDYHLPIAERIAIVRQIKEKGYSSDFQEKVAEHYLIYKEKEEELYAELMRLTDALYQ